MKNRVSHLYATFNRYDILDVNKRSVTLSNTHESETHEYTEENDHEQYIELHGVLQFYRQNRKNVKFGHINVNSVRNKHAPLATILTKGFLDILAIQETKLDNSFPDNQFQVNGFRMYRNDYTSRSGGIMLYVRDDIQQRRRCDFECIQCDSGKIEHLSVEVSLNEEKWLLVSIYKHPKVKDADFVSYIGRFVDTCTTEYKNIMLFGDMNIDVSKKGNCLKDVFELHGVKNITREPTCFKNHLRPSMIDLVITNVPQRLQNVTCVDNSLSDFHTLLCFSTKMHINPKQHKTITYRSYKKFDVHSYQQSLSSAPFAVAEIFDDVNDAYHFTQSLMNEIINEHAPLKQKRIKHKQVPYMNSELRKAINVKNMLKRKYDKNQCTVNWNKYRYHRRIVSNIRKISAKKYISEKCKDTLNGKGFWEAVSPYFSYKSKNIDSDIVILENGSIINEKAKVADIFNDYFINATDNVSRTDKINEEDDIPSIIDSHRAHPSIISIRERHTGTFSFKPVSSEYVLNKLYKMNTKKATGHDNIPPKLLKLGANILAGPITFLINESIKTSIFPDQLKCANVIPLYKKGDSLLTSNYRPISILPSLSKIFECVLIDQLSEYFEPLLDDVLSGFRKQHGCQHVLLNFVEKCKNVLDDGKLYGALLTDLSKAFECVPHRLLISKLNAYGMDYLSCKLISSYFLDRKQRVKLGSVKGQWMALTRGTPQGSIFGPFIFNLFQNDMMYVLKQHCDIYNYADDTTLGVGSNTVVNLCMRLQRATHTMLEWCSINHLKANPDKFQFIIFSTKENNASLHISDNVTIMSRPCVKLLGVFLDSHLKFGEHITTLCKKAGKHLNVLARMSRSLDVKGKLILMQSFITCHFNYCSIIWHYCSASDLKKIENVQYRGLKFVYYDFLSSYVVLRERAGLPLLYVRRLRTIALELFKICNDIGPSYLKSYFKRSSRQYDMRRGSSLVLPKYKTVKYGKKCFKFHAVKLWNDLNYDCTHAANLQAFREIINVWSGPQCQCSYCDICVLHRF